MAKKLNKKIAIIGIILLALVIAGGCAMFIALKIHRSPGRALKLHQKALEAGDYLEAEKQLGRAYAFGKTDEDKIQRLFELADFHLIQNDQHQAEWNKAMGCWNKIASIDPGNMQARRALLDFFYQAADAAGDAGSWRNVKENTTEMLDALRKQGVEPDAFILKAHAKALLSIARRGETTDRRTPLDECVAMLTELLEKQPANEELYLLMAEAETVNGELNTLAGVIDAGDKARQKGIDLLETGIEQSDDKATAVANLILHKMRQAGNDPNSVEAIRAEIEQRSKQVQPNDKLWSVTSMAYESTGKMSAEAEINRAIEAIRKAHELKPEDFEYTLRMAKLMYRKGNAFDDPAATEDALQIAENALDTQEVQDLPGPLRSRNVNYRFALNTFLADLYLEKAISLRDSDDVGLSEGYVQKAEERIEEIVSLLGTTDHPTAQKFQGFVELAKGQQDKAVRLLYKAYEQNRALDKEGEFSNVDPRVCVALAQIAEQQNEPGLQREFLQVAFASQDRYIMQKPTLFLDYAETINRLRNFPGWPNLIEQLVELYQRSYGANDQSRKLSMGATLAQGKLEEAKEQLSAFDHLPAVKLRYELEIVLGQIIQIRRSIAELEEEGKEPALEQTQELETLYSQRNSLLEKLLQLDPKEIDPQRMIQICSNLIRNDQADLAVDYLDTYLAANPDALNLIQLRLMAQQEDPQNLSSEQEAALQEQAIDSLGDAKQKALLQAERYRSQAEHEKALQVLEQNAQVDADDPEIVLARFDVVLDQKDISSAETLHQIIRRENLDRCEGNLAAARVEIAKENYPLALRRLDECIALRPLSSYTYFIKSQVQRQSEDLEGAVESARTSIRMNPKNAAYARNYASIVFGRNLAMGSKLTKEQEQEAERAIGFAMGLNPTDWQLQSVYAESIQLKAPDQALSIRQRLLETNPTGANALMLGNMALRMSKAEWDAAKKTGLIELAGTAYQQGIEIEPDNESLRQAFADYLSLTQQNEKAIDLLKGDENMLWKFYLRNGQFEQAGALLRDLLQKSPDDPLLVQGLVLVSQGLGNRDDIKQYLDKMSELDQTKETEKWILQKYLDNGFSDEAESKLASFKERYPDDSSILLIESWTEMGKGRLDEALTLSNRYLETDTNNPGAWRLRGRIYRLLNQPRKAVDDLQRSKSLRDTPEVRMELATVYVEMDQVTAAIGELVASLDNPQAPQRARFMLEDLYQKNNRAAELDKFYVSMIQKYPENPYWYLRSGAYYLDQKDFLKAQEFFQKVLDQSLKNNQPNSTALEYYLECLLQSKQYDKAIAVASGYVDGPLAHIAYGFIAQVQMEQNQPQKAIGSFYKALDKAGTNDAVLEGIMKIMLRRGGEKALTAWINDKLAADSTSLPAHLLTSSLATMQGSYNKAIEEMDQCLDQVEPDSPQWSDYALKKVNLLLMAYTKTVDQDYLNRATELLSALIELQPNNASMLNNLAYLLADNDQQLEKALEYSRKAHQRAPGDPVFLDTYAYIQCKTGQYKQAEENLIRAGQMFEVAGQSAPWDFYQHFGMAKEGLGKTSQAIEMYQKALEASDQVPEAAQQQLQQAIQRLEQL